MHSLQQQIEFLQEMDKLKAVHRRITVKAAGNRGENSAEHSWHIALQALLLQQYAETNIDILRVVKMLLIHDVVEIDAGDTFAFAAHAELDGQNAKEAIAARRIFGLLPQDQATEYEALWHEFEALETPEAQYAKAMDCLLPALQNMNNNGGSWAVYKISRSQILKRNQQLEKVSPPLWQYFLTQVDLAVAKGWLLDQ